MAPREPGVLKRAVLWLLFLGPFFFASYGLANWLTSQRGDVGSLVFDWERGMPLWPWTILPYWSIDLLYGLSLLLPRDKRELDTHCLRLLSAQVLSVTCFLLFPLRFTFERPELGGVFGWLFDVLMGFDKPYNQAPSLHIALLVVLWVCYARYASGAWRWLLHGWFALIGLSVLTTWQHHFIDVPTGALAGWLCVWLWPQAQPAPFARASLSRDRQRRRLAARYGLGALACAAVAFAVGGAALWLRSRTRCCRASGWGACRRPRNWPTAASAHCSTLPPNFPASRRGWPIAACRCSTWSRRTSGTAGAPPR